MDRAPRTRDGGYILTGDSSSFGSGWPELYLVKTDAGGREQWSKTFDGAEWVLARGESVQQTDQGGYIVCGRKMWFGFIGPGLEEIDRTMYVVYYRPDMGAVFTVR